MPNPSKGPRTAVLVRFPPTLLERVTVAAGTPRARNETILELIEKGLKRR